MSTLKEEAPYLVAALQRYADERIETGGFLRACLENDLIKAANCADLQNRGRLYLIASYIYNNLPLGCYGSAKKVDRWLEGT